MSHEICTPHLLRPRSPRNPPIPLESVMVFEQTPQAWVVTGFPMLNWLVVTGTWENHFP